MAKISTVSWNIFLRFRAMPLRQRRNSGELLSPKGRTATKRDIWIVEAWDPCASGEHVSPCERTLLPASLFLRQFVDDFHDHRFTASRTFANNASETFVALTCVFLPRSTPFPSKRVWAFSLLIFSFAYFPASFEISDVISTMFAVLEIKFLRFRDGRYMRFSFALVSCSPTCFSRLLVW